MRFYTVNIFLQLMLRIVTLKKLLKISTKDFSIIKKVFVRIHLKKSGSCRSNLKL